MSTRSWLAALRAVFFLSGFTGLVFEVLWTRQLSSVVGSTSVAMTCVFSAFIVCLSLGAWIGSRLPFRDRGALVAYAVAEIAIGVAGFAITIGILHGDVQLARWVPFSSTTGDVLVQMGVTFVLIGVPTTMMGATLPLVMNGIRRKALPSGLVAGLYGANVIGGAFGALACGFVLLWRLGVTGTSLFALGVDVALGIVALLLARGLAAAGPPTRDAGDAEPRAVQRGGDVGWLYPTLAFLTGFFALSYELLWGRMAKLYMGDRTMATATLLFIYLACMALGSFAVGFLHRRKPPSDLGTGLARFGAMLGLAAFAHLVGVALIHLALDDSSLVPGMANQAWPRVLATVIVTIVPVTVLGMAFPFLMQTARQIDERPGSTVGRLYFVNSVGAGLGALYGGFVAPNNGGTLTGFVLTSVGVAALAVACQWRGGRTRMRRAAAAGLTVLLLVFGAWLMPDDLLFYEEGETLLAWNEDEYGVQLASRTPEGTLHVKSNRLYVAYTLGPMVTNFTQETISYASCLLSAHCSKVLNIGTGYGITAGAFTNMDAVESVTTIEVLPFVCDLQPMFGEFNFAYYEDPRVTRVCTDGRRVLAASEELYDIISVNVLDPYVPGSAALFTIDFWQMAKARLTPGGAYSQLIWGPDAERLLAGMRSVFPTVLAFPGGWKDTYNAVALAEPVPPALHADRVTEALREAMEKFSIPDPAAFFAEHLELAIRVDAAARARPHSFQFHTDDMPILEYRWARGDGMTDTYDSYWQTSMFDSLTVEP